MKKLTAEVALSADALRAVRAVQVLEGIGDADAMGMLKEMARGASRGYGQRMTPLRPSLA